VDLIAVVDPPRAGLRKLKKKLPFSDSASIYFLSTDQIAFVLIFYYNNITNNIYNTIISTSERLNNFFQDR